MTEQRIHLSLSSAGFRGADVDVALPDFMTVRPTTVGLTWYSPADGSETASLSIVVGMAARGFVSGFASDLSRDLCRWARERLVSLFRSKRSPLLLVTLKLEDIQIRFETDDFRLRKDGQTALESFLLALPQLAGTARPDVSAEWNAEYDGERWILQQGLETSAWNT